MRDRLCELVPSFLSGLLAPGVELVLCDLTGPDPGKPFLVLPAVNLEYLILALALFPYTECSDLLAGAALLVKGTVAITESQKS